MEPKKRKGKKNKFKKPLNIYPKSKPKAGTRYPVPPLKFNRASRRV